MKDEAIQVLFDAKLIRHLAFKSKDPDLEKAASRGDALRSEFDAAVIANDDSGAREAARKLAVLRETVRAQRSKAKSSRGEAIRMTVSVIGLIVVVICFVWFLFTYGQTVGLAQLGTIEGTRPLLVIGAILSTVVFGGSLLIGSLFSSDGTFEDRFRHAREVFLVFSGIFGTVIGFYFGAGDKKGDLLGISAELADSVLVAHANGGTAPYKITLTYGDRPCVITLASKDGWARFAINKSTETILDAHLSAFDARGTQSGSATLSKTRSDLAALGWTLPAKSSCDVKAG